MKKPLESSFICLHCMKKLCEIHENSHTFKHPIRINTKNIEIKCAECKQNLGENLLREAEKLQDNEYKMLLEDFINEIASRIDKPKENSAKNIIICPESDSVKSQEIIKTPETSEEEKMPIEKLKSQKIKFEIKGLGNLGNTCYFNSVMQCLNASQFLVDHIMKAEFSGTGQVLHKRLLEFFINIRNSKGTVYNPEQILNAVRGKCGKFRGKQQQDSHEFLMTFLDRLIDEEQKFIKETNKEENVNMFDTEIMKIFGSHLVNKVHCLGCQQDCYCFDPCTVYSLPMSCQGNSGKYLYEKSRTMVWRRNMSGKKRAYEEENIKTKIIPEIPQISDEEALKSDISENKYKFVEINDKKYLEPCKAYAKYKNDDDIKSLNDCLRAFFNKEILSTEKNNSFECPKCSKNGLTPKSIREYFIGEAPKILALQLKRFTAVGHLLKKNPKRIEIPLTINIDDFLLLPCLEGKEEQVEEMKKLKIEDKINIYEYKLYGIVSHSGGMGGGHYVAYVKNEQKWFYISDSHVSEVTEKRVLSIEGYIAFYELQLK